MHNDAWPWWSLNGVDGNFRKNKLSLKIHISPTKDKESQQTQQEGLPFQGEGRLKPVAMIQASEESRSSGVDCGMVWAVKENAKAVDVEN